MIKKRPIECDLIELYALMGKKWTIPILHNITSKPISFNELKRISNNLISPILLSTRLKELVSFKIIIKRKIKGKIVYMLTQEGKGLKKLMIYLKKWAISSNYTLPKECNIKKCYCDMIFN